MIDILADRPWARTLLTGVAIAALCLVTGKAVVSYPLTYLLAPVGLGAVAAIAWWNRGVLTGILVLLLLEGVPFINTGAGSSAGAGANAASDAAFVVLVVFLAIWAFDSTRNRAQDRIAILASTWASCYFAWWLYKTVAASPGIPVLSAVSYGREFFGFSLFFPLALLALRRRPHLVGFAITLAVGAAIFSVGQIVEQLAHADLSWLIHIIKTNEFEGLTRIYSKMGALLTAAFPMALAATLLGPKAWRRGAMLLTVLTGLADALSFTRATYASELPRAFPDFAYMGQGIRMAATPYTVHICFWRRRHRARRRVRWRELLHEWELILADPSGCIAFRARAQQCAKQDGYRSRPYTRGRSRSGSPW